MGAAGARIPAAGATIRGRPGRLAQLVERLPYTQVAAGSSPAPPISSPASMRVWLNHAPRACREGRRGTLRTPSLPPSAIRPRRRAALGSRAPDTRPCNVGPRRHLKKLARDDPNDDARQLSPRFLALSGPAVLIFTMGLNAADKNPSRRPHVASWRPPNRIPRASPVSAGRLLDAARPLSAPEPRTVGRLGSGEVWSTAGLRRAQAPGAQRVR